MLNAWSDHECQVIVDFYVIPLIDADAPIWCLLLPHECESLVFLQIFSLIPLFFLSQHKI
jgi:hypothetical protein